MKKSLLCIFLMMACKLNAQVSWEADARKQGDHQIQVTLHLTIEKDWSVYAADDTAKGLTALKLRIGNKQYPLKGKTEIIRDPLFNHAAEKVFRLNFNCTQFVNIKDDIPETISIGLSGFASNRRSFLPIDETRQVPIAGASADSSRTASGKIKLSGLDLRKPVSDCGDKEQNKSLLAIFLLGLAGGLVALVTPCVFPMIPLTVSFFIRQEKKKYGILYGLFILYIYMLASVPFHIAGSLDPQIFNTISTNPWVNLVFFILFVLFALSFFGLFEITLPASVTNRVGNKSGGTSVTGILFMALTLVVVSFSCTGPILGSLLAGSANAGAWALTAGMTGFGLALGAPFALFAIFPQWISRIPKSSDWLATVKIILAFIELAFAFKFLSNADLVGHWGFFKREIFLGVWIGLAVTLAAYLIGIFLRDIAEGRKRQPVKLLLGLVFMFFSFYLGRGLGGKDLGLLSGFPPPKSYSIFLDSGPGREAVVVNDYEKAVSLAREQGKPILVDFTGWACVNCRKMEENVWTDPRVAAAIRENYILVSLYVDDRQSLAENISYKDRVLETLGDKWAAFESENFAQVSQPLYVLLSPDGRLLNHPVGYTPDGGKYRDWLECGMNAYKSTRRN